MRARPARLRRRPVRRRRAARRPQRECLWSAGGVVGGPKGRHRRGVFLDRERQARGGGAFGVQSGGGAECGGMVEVADRTQLLLLVAPAKAGVRRLMGVAHEHPSHPHQGRLQARAERGFRFSTTSRGRAARMAIASKSCSPWLKPTRPSSSRSKPRTVRVVESRRHG